MVRTDAVNAAFAERTRLEAAKRDEGEAEPGTVDARGGPGVTVRSSVNVMVIVLECWNESELRLVDATGTGSRERTY